ncbi:hypothetical protein ACWT_3377 [Actinoplanes sp. SE50]|uniref:hypothetical protein n=1 Tax=unclassified Actinoplanes TaxID=2626549 RepID=UPI00023ED22A|nr:MULTISPECIES: hypothetical protein [unclassified Actinoplanes]AEV84400.1 hypothetical protein ACPL_3505 [Actinoplanes sp. SE50/110]ATO82792.1 hypothetical protein ACWT_3377 [Actinoplanes sp. SE50]SLM00200.1 hypothetical protein ACSP50_3432 [Actinoplanes sp. SE50/110]
MDAWSGRLVNAEREQAADEHPFAYGCLIEAAKFADWLLAQEASDSPSRGAEPDMG